METISTDKGDPLFVLVSKRGGDCNKWGILSKIKAERSRRKALWWWGAVRVKKAGCGGNCVRKEVAGRLRQGRSKGQCPSEKRGRCIQVMHIRFHIIAAAF